MPRSDLSEIVLVVDRSGSMLSCKDDAEGGVNAFIAEQKALPGDANLTLVQFDDTYEIVHDGVAIADVGPYVLNPRGMTALLDAVGKAITTVGARLDGLSEDQKPGTVVVCIVTDGHENSSREYTADRVRALIKEQQDVYSWKFTFLGADASAFETGASIGIAASAVAQYDPNAKSGAAFSAMSSVTSCARSASMRGENYNVCYSNKTRKSLR